MDNHQNKNHQQHALNSSSSRPTVVHSTHSYCETFDQATRDAQLEQGNNTHHNASGNETMATGTTESNNHRQYNSNHLEANSAVQLDRDVQQSRKTADENRQKASGGERSVPIDSRNALPYVE
ncbi:hypothetical protein BGZ94_006578 [Podila epigama]|nr:hypothetical protein BGZ94_006578 [Podila epigama]